MLLWDEDIVLHQGVYSLILVANFYLDGIVKRGSLELLDLGGHGCRKEISVSILGYLGQD